MRNPFRKISPEEEYVNNFLNGMKKSGLPSQEARDIYVLIKRRRDEGDYVRAKALADECLENLRQEQVVGGRRQTQEIIDALNQ